VDAEEPPVGAALGDESSGHELLNAGPRRTASASRAREERERDGGGGLEGTPRSGGYWPFYRRLLLGLRGADGDASASVPRRGTWRASGGGARKPRARAWALGALAAAVCVTRGTH
jgi:hypothetical protein